LKRYKTLCIDQIAAEFTKAEVRTVHSEILELIIRANRGYRSLNAWHFNVAVLF
jgi:hypothetical protein